MVIFLSCQEDEPAFNDNSTIESVAIERNQINEMLLKQTFEDNIEVDWRSFSDEQLWAAYQFANNITIVGWEEGSTSTSEKNEILSFVRKSEGLTDNKDFVIEELENLQVLVLKVERKETLLGLKRMNRAAELFEIGYEMLSEEENLAIEEEERKSSENFSKSSVALSISNLGGTVIEYPTRFDYHGISTAWSRGLNGRNIGIAIIDSGVLEDDKTFGKNYGQNINGMNPSHLNKTYTQNGFYKWCTWCWWYGYDGVYTKGFDPLERGTKSLKIAAGPMGSRARTGELTGISYASNVTSVRGSYSYYINRFASLMAVTKSFEHLSEQGDVDIISTSLSRTLASSMLSRAIKKCTSRGKLVFTAVGAIPESYYGSNLFFSMNRTATLFPARMSETYVCAGVIKDTKEWCNFCHGQADFVTEFGPTDINQSSSFSTATTAGIAGLIWGQNPNKSADQVVQEMIDISDNGNRRKGWRGHGRLHLKRYNLRNQL